MTRKMYKGKTFEKVICPVDGCGRPIRAENTSLHGHMMSMHPRMTVRERSNKVKELLEEVARRGSSGEA